MNLNNNNNNNMDPEPTVPGVPAAGQEGAFTASAVFPSPALPGPQSNAHLSSLGTVGLLDLELAHHHVGLCASHKPELVAECHRFGIPTDLTMPEVTLPSRLLTY